MAATTVQRPVGGQANLSLASFRTNETTWATGGVKFGDVVWSSDDDSGHGHLYSTSGRGVGLEESDLIHNSNLWDGGHQNVDQFCTRTCAKHIYILRTVTCTS